MNALVVISHYNAWPTDQLVALLDQVGSVPAGMPFDLLVVVNRDRPELLALPDRHRDVPVLYRENTGYNIGAWDHGWRHDGAQDCYLFLQEECRIVRPDWLRALCRLAMRPDVGLVGESMHWGGRSWRRLRYEYRGAPFPELVDGRSLPYSDAIRAKLEGVGIGPGRTGAHLQSLVLCIRREVLEAIGGFGIGLSYGDAVLAEVAISKRVEALGLNVREVGPGSFRYILHPQWARRQGIRQAIGRAVLRTLPARVAERLRKPAQ